MDDIPTYAPLKAGEPDPRVKRPEFLIEMYKQMMSDINRHIVVVWQSVGVVIGSFALMGLVEKKVISIDAAAGLLELICTWSLLLLIDAGYWYNRNLCIIANIERLFLSAEDLRHVHYYFGSHRPENKMITTLKIQFWFAEAIALLVLLYHVSVRFGDWSWSAFFPYIVGVAGAIMVSTMSAERDRNYAEFVKNSPGIKVDITGTEYGGGHGFDRDGG